MHPYNVHKIGRGPEAKTAEKGDFGAKKPLN